MATLVALGPGDPDLVPLAAWRALEAAGPVAVPDDEPLAGWLGEHGIAIDPDAPVAAASGERFRRLLAERDWDEVVPGGDALRDLLLADAMVGLQRLTERLRVDCPWDREQTAATIVPHTIEEAYEVAEAVGERRRGQARRRAGRPALPDVLPRAPLPRRTARATWPRWRPGSPRSSSAATRTSSASARRRRPVRCAETGSRSSATTRAGPGSSTTSRACCPRCFMPARCSGGRPLSGSTGDAGSGAWPQLESELAELRSALDDAPRAACRARARRRRRRRDRRSPLRRGQRGAAGQRRPRAGAAGGRGALPRRGSRRPSGSPPRRGRRGPSSTSTRRTPGTGGRRRRWAGSKAAATSSAVGGSGRPAAHPEQDSRRSSSTAGSSIVAGIRHSSPSAILRIVPRRTLPERVFGSAVTMRTSLNDATGPISSRTRATSSAATSAARARRPPSAPRSRSAPGP